MKLQENDSESSRKSWSSRKVIVVQVHVVGIWQPCHRCGWRLPDVWCLNIPSSPSAWEGQERRAPEVEEETLETPLHPLWRRWRGWGCPVTSYSWVSGWWAVWPHRSDLTLRGLLKLSWGFLRSSCSFSRPAAPHTHHRYRCSTGEREQETFDLQFSAYRAEKNFKEVQVLEAPRWDGSVDGCLDLWVFWVSDYFSFLFLSAAAENTRATLRSDSAVSFLLLMWKTTILFRRCEGSDISNVSMRKELCTCRCMCACVCACSRMHWAWV